MPHFHTYEFEELGSELDSLIPCLIFGQNGGKVGIMYSVKKNQFKITLFVPKFTQTSSQMKILQITFPKVSQHNKSESPLIVLVKCAVTSHGCNIRLPLPVHLRED